MSEQAAFKNPFQTRSQTTGDEEFSAEGEVNSLVPEGTYKAKLVDLVAGESKSSGDPMWTWTFALMEGPGVGREFKDYTSLNDDAIWKRNKNIVACDIAQPDANGKIQVKFKKKDVLGKQCQVKIVHEEYKGRMMAKIADVLPV